MGYVVRLSNLPRAPEYQDFRKWVLQVVCTASHGRYTIIPDMKVIEATIDSEPAKLMTFIQEEYERVKAIVEPEPIEHDFK
jgi:hypothetical protein